jgi:hypothetical protein
MGQPDPEHPFYRQQKKEMQVKSQFRIGQIQVFEVCVEIQKIKQPFVFAGIDDTGVFIQALDFFQVMIIQREFLSQAVHYFPGEIAVVARVEIGEVIRCVSQQVINGTAYPAPDPGDQSFEKLEKVHG